MLIYIMSYNDIIITNPDVIKPHYDFIKINIAEPVNTNENMKSWKPLEFWFNKNLV